MCANFQAKGTTMTFLAQFAQNEFWGQNFKNLSPGSESAPQRYHECQFSVKMNNFRFFGLNLGKLPISCGILVLIRLRELVGGWNELDGGEWCWVEVKMSWVEVGARFSNTPQFLIDQPKSCRIFMLGCIKFICF